MKDEKLLSKWILGELSPEEEKLFKKSVEYSQYVKIWDTLPEVATPPQLGLDDELKRFWKERNARSESKVVRLSWSRQLIGIAASLLLIGIFSYLIFQNSFRQTEDMVVSTPHVPIYLPDSSAVVLNKGSKLAYSEDGWAENRSVSLEGEGFFVVKKGSTFDVMTTNGQITVLGTSFNVKHQSDFLKVVCYEGRVGVKTSKHNLELWAGKGFQLVKEESTKFDLSSGQNPDWMDGKSSFLKTPLYVVLAEIETQYDISIETNGLDLQSTFTGSFPNDNLKIAIEAISTPTGYHYQINNNKVLISREGE